MDVIAKSDKKQNKQSYRKHIDDYYCKDLNIY